MDFPMTPEQRCIANTEESARKHGIWWKVCNGCGATVGGCLAEYGPPTDLHLCACPFCDQVGNNRAEYQPGEGKE